MNRRDALKTSSLILGYSLTAGTAVAVLSGCQADPALDWTPVNLDKKQALLVAELCEIIIPKTETPGAREALVDRFIDAILDAQEPEVKETFLTKLTELQNSIKEQFGKPLYKCDEEQKKLLVQQMFESSDRNDRHDLFRMIKEWTVVGYCCSEAGATEHLEWDPVPGPYQGCIDFSEVGKTWALG